jgi:hypothetical protein
MFHVAIVRPAGGRRTHRQILLNLCIRTLYKGGNFSKEHRYGSEFGDFVKDDDHNVCERTE